MKCTNHGYIHKCHKGWEEIFNPNQTQNLQRTSPRPVLDSGNVYSDLTGWWLEWLEMPWLVVSASDDSDPEHGFPSFTSTGTATLCGTTRLWVLHKILLLGSHVSGINFKHSSLKSKELESPRSPRCSSPAWRRPGPSGRLGHGLLLGLPLVLVTVVLEPDLHLRIRTCYFSANVGWLRFQSCSGLFFGLPAKISELVMVWLQRHRYGHPRQDKGDGEINLRHFLTKKAIHFLQLHLHRRQCPSKHGETCHFLFKFS